jgi:hypothetical protein
MCCERRANDARGEAFGTDQDLSLQFERCAIVRSEKASDTSNNGRTELACFLDMLAVFTEFEINPP